MIAASSAYARDGYEVILDGLEFHYTVLRASFEEAMRRAVNRAKLDHHTNVELVRVMYPQFAELGQFERCVVDNTALDAAQSAAAVRALLESGKARLS